MGLIDGLKRGISRAASTGAKMFTESALEKQRALIQTERDARLAEIAERTAIAAEQRGITNRATERDLIDRESADPERIARQVEAARLKATGELGIRSGLVNQAADLERRQFEAGAGLRGQKTAEEIANEARRMEGKLQFDIERTNNPQYLAGRRKVAQAGHIDTGAGLRNMKIEDMREVRSLIQEYDKTTDPARRAAIEQALIIRGAIKPRPPVDHGTEEIITTRDEGGVIIETRIKRPHTAPAAQPRSTAQPLTRAGLEQLIKDGRISRAEANRRLRAAGLEPLDTPQMSRGTVQ